MPGSGLSIIRWLGGAMGFSAVLASSAFAQTAPDGWKVFTTSGAWVAQSPGAAGEQVELVAWPAEKSRATFDFWFEERGLALARALPGHDWTAVKTQARTEASLQPPHPRILAQARVLVDRSGAEAGVYTYAWQTPKGRQIVQIVMPVKVGKQSPAYRAAFDQMSAFWRSGEVYSPEE